MDCFADSLFAFAGFGDDPFGAAVGAGYAERDDSFVEPVDGVAPAGEFGGGVVGIDVARPVDEPAGQWGAFGELVGCGQVVPDLVLNRGFDEEGVVVAGAG